MANRIFLIPLLLLAIGIEPILGFKAAVFEHAQQSYAMPSGKPEDIVRSNLEYYATATRLASSQVSTLNSIVGELNLRVAV